MIKVNKERLDTATNALMEILETRIKMRRMLDFIKHNNPNDEDIPKVEQALKQLELMTQLLDDEITRMKQVFVVNPN